MANSNLKALATQMHLLTETEENFPKNLQQLLAAQMDHPAKLKFISELVSSGVLEDGSDESAKISSLLEEIMGVGIAMTCSKGAEGTGAIVKALEAGQNTEVISHLRQWFKKDFGLEAHHDLSEAMQGSSKRVQVPTAAQAPGPGFFYKAPPLKGLEKVATFSFQTESGLEGASQLQFQKDRLVAHLNDTTRKEWNWSKNEEKTLNIEVAFANFEADISDYAYDDGIIVVGTAEGSVHLLDATTQEEKWSVRLGSNVDSIQICNSTVVVRTQDVEGGPKKLWKLELCRADMRLFNQKPLDTENIDMYGDIFVDSLFIFVRSGTTVHVYSTQTGDKIRDEENEPCTLESTSEICGLSVIDLISMKRVVVAGFFDGTIAMWTTTNLANKQRPIKSWQGHTEEVDCFCALQGHLITLDTSGRLLMWSGYDLENEHVRAPLPRLLAQDDQDFFNVSDMVGCERWIASSSHDDNNVNIWALPDLWLRTG